MITADLTLFLDFDGVLHPLWSPAPYNDWTLERIHGPTPYTGPFFVHAPVLAELLTGYLPHIDIVISSTWGEKYDLAALRKFLPAELSERVTDAVYHRLPPMGRMDQRAEVCASRWNQIQWYREQVRPDIGDRWLAIDDDDRYWPTESRIHLAHCDRPLGDPASQKAVEDALLLFRLVHPATEDLAAMHARGEQPGAVGLDDAGTLVQRGEDGQLHPYHL